jgi:ribosomal protein S18 acetylase RimI-like enzyme
VSGSAQLAVRRAGVEDAETAAQLLHDFNVEFDDPTPEVPVLAERLRRLIETGDVTIMLGGEGPDGIAVMRLRPSFWSGALDAYLEELYVVPPRRGAGIGRALLEGTMDAAREAGATRMDLGTSVDDKAAIALYESSGFTNSEGVPDGPAMLFYERDL